MHSDKSMLLLVEAHSSDANNIMKMLGEVNHQHSFMIEVVETLADDIRHINEADIAIVNLSLPDSKGISTFRAINEASIIPIVVIANNCDHKVGLQAIKDGAQDYLVIGQFDAQTLYRSILYAMERHRRELAEKRLGTILRTITLLRTEVSNLTNEVRDCREAIANLTISTN